MWFVGIALLVAAGLALLISADAGSLIGLTQQQTGRALPGVILLVVLGASLFARRMPFGQMIRGLAAWAMIFVVVIGAYTYRFELQDFAGRVTGELSPGAAIVSDDGQTVSFRRGLGGSFLLSTDVNGAEVRMLFDTGASAVVLTQADARAAGIEVDNLRYGVRVQTANGVSTAALTRLDSITVGGIERRNIRAYVAQPGALEMSLLGMTFLETLERFSVAQDRLELQG